MPDPQQPWKPADATLIINEIASARMCTFSYTVHARERMAERGLILSDLLFALRSGFVYSVPEESTIKGYYKYKVESQTPNSGSRSLRLVVVPDRKSCQIKVITIMWRDEG